MILLLRLLLSFCFDWKDISSTRDSVSSAVQTPRISSKIPRCPSYFQLSSRCLDIPLKHCLSCLIYYLKFKSKRTLPIHKYAVWIHLLKSMCTQSFSSLQDSVRHRTDNFSIVTVRSPSVQTRWRIMSQEKKNAWLFTVFDTFPTGSSHVRVVAW